MIRLKGYTMNEFNLPATVAQMKAEVLAYIAQGRIPATVSSFGELHDYIDANTLGGFCDDDRPINVRLSELEEERATLTEEQERNWAKSGELAELQEQDTDFLNAAQDAINAWILSDDFSAAVSEQINQSKEA